MAIKPICEDEQQVKLEKYNLTKQRNNKIPLVPRNRSTGWPLLCVSCFKPVTNGSRVVGLEPIINDGPGQLNYLVAIALAHLLEKCFTKTILNNQVVTGGHQFRLSSIDKFSSSFNINFQKLNIGIVYANTFKERKLTITLPPQFAYLEEQFNKLFNHNFQSIMQANSDERSLNRPQTFSSIASTSDERRVYTKHDFNRYLNKKVAVFFNQQIYVDLGYFLSQLKDDNLTAFFARLFKVSQFKQLFPNAINERPQSRSRNLELMIDNSENFESNLFYQLHMRFVKRHFFSGNRDYQLRDFATIVNQLTMADNQAGNYTSQLNTIKHNLANSEEHLYFSLRERLFSEQYHIQLKTEFQEYKSWLDDVPDKVNRGILKARHFSVYKAINEEEYTQLDNIKPSFIKNL